MNSMLQLFAQYQPYVIIVEAIIILVMIFLYSKILKGKVNLDPNYLFAAFSKTSNFDQKKFASLICVICFVFTWLRLSLGYPVNSILGSPSMWFCFYGVVAAHDLVEKMVDAYKNVQLNGASAPPVAVPAVPAPVVQPPAPDAAANQGN